ncbi:MAG: hypothetical protein QOG14_5281 [Mycobacterium sp.]|jgi:hypothetical protein|nr:hypothetical protein [Mycobacterium sp.]
MASNIGKHPILCGQRIHNVSSLEIREVSHTKGEIMNTNGNKLALRRQSIRTLTDSELRFAHGGAPSVAPAPGTDRQTVTGPGTSVIKLTGAVTSAVVHLTGAILNPSGGRQNPSGG